MIPCSGMAKGDTSDTTTSTDQTTCGTTVVYQIYDTYVDDAMMDLLNEIRNLAALQYLKSIIEWRTYRTPKIPSIFIKRNRKNNRQMLIKRRYNQGIHSDTKSMAFFIALLLLFCFMCR